MAQNWTPRLNLMLQTKNTQNWDVNANNIFSSIDAQQALGALAVAAADHDPDTGVPTSLNVKVSAGWFCNASGLWVAVPATAALALAANATNYVYLDDAGAVHANTAGFPAGANYVPLAAVTCAATAVTSIADARAFLFSAGAGGGGAGGGGVSSVGLALPGTFAVTGSPITGAGTLTATWTAQNPNQALLGPVSGGAAAPTFRLLQAGDLPRLMPSGPTHAAGIAPDPGPTPGSVNFLREDCVWAVPPGGGAGGGGVSNVGLSMPADFAVAGSPVTALGTFAVTWNNQNAGMFFAGPVPGAAAAAPGWRALYPADLPVFGGSGAAHQPGAVPDPGPVASNQRYLCEDGTFRNPSFSVFVGSGPNHAAGGVPDPGPAAGTLRFLREDGSWSTVPSSAGGTVTSVGLGLPGELTVSGSPVTGAGTLAAAWAPAAAHAVFAGPAGAAGTPAFRALAAGDIPDLSAVYLTGNQIITFTGDVAGSGATAVTLALGAGKVTNAHLAGGIAFTKLVGTDITISAGQVTAGTFDPARLPAAGLRIDQHYGTWQPLPAPVGTTITLDLSLSDHWYGTLPAGTTTFAFANGRVAPSLQQVMLRLKQPAGGNALATWPPGSLAAGAVLSTAGGAVDYVSALFNPDGNYDIFTSRMGVA